MSFSENLQNEELKQKNIHKFENMWILTEPTELSCINGQTWYTKYETIKNTLDHFDNLLSSQKTISRLSTLQYLGEL